MCTAVLSIGRGSPTLLAGVRDELIDRAWQPPGRHWPEHQDLIGGRDLQAGGTWLAVNPGARRVACVLNGVGEAAPPDIRRSRGELPLLAAAGQPLDTGGLAGLDPFLLLVASPGAAMLSGWDGRTLTQRALHPGLHMVVNSALMSWGPEDTGTAGLYLASGGQPPDGREHERARLDRFLALFAKADRPQPRPGLPTAEAWGGWFPLVNGDGLSFQAPAALIVRRDLGGGRVWGSTSVSLVAASQAGVRYDFCGRPGDPAAWEPVL